MIGCVVLILECVINPSMVVFYTFTDSYVYNNPFN